MLEYVDAADPVIYWTAADLAEDSPEDAHRFTDATRAVIFHSGDGDGAALIGTTPEIIARLEKVIATLRTDAAPIVDGEVIEARPPLPRPPQPLSASPFPVVDVDPTEIAEQIEGFARHSARLREAEEGRA